LACKLYSFIILLPLLSVDVFDFFGGMTVRQMLLWQTVSSHICVEVDRIPRLGLSACFVVFSDVCLFPDPPLVHTVGLSGHVQRFSGVLCVRSDGRR